LLKLYRNDLEYLKSELKSQNDISERLNESLTSTRDELEDAKKQNLVLKTKYDETSKKYDDIVKEINLELTFY
jgi:hypothetical protein